MVGLSSCNWVSKLKDTNCEDEIIKVIRSLPSGEEIGTVSKLRTFIGKYDPSFLEKDQNRRWRHHDITDIATTLISHSPTLKEYAKISLQHQYICTSCGKKSDTNTEPDSYILYLEPINGSTTVQQLLDKKSYQKKNCDGICLENSVDSSVERNHEHIWTLKNYPKILLMCYKRYWFDQAAKTAFKTNEKIIAEYDITVSEKEYHMRAIVVQSGVYHVQASLG